MKSKFTLLTVLILFSAICAVAQESSTFTDSRDGRTYKTIKLGNQIWMAENLNTSKFRNGDIIPEAKNDVEWIKACEQGAPISAYYDFSPFSLDYGKEYNFFAVSDSRNLCPIGWHVPSNDEWNQLNTFFNNTDDSVYIRDPESHWEKNVTEDDMDADDDSDEYDNYDATSLSDSSDTAITETSGYGFDALPAGHLFIIKSGLCFHGNENINGFWWSSTSIDTDSANCTVVDSDDDSFFIGKRTKNCGLNVRCIKD